MTAPTALAGFRPPDPLDSPRTQKKSFADIVSGVTTQNHPAISLKKPQMYSGKPAIGIPKSELTHLASEYKYALIGKFSHGRPSMNMVRQKFVSIGLKGAYTLGSIDARHLLINLKLEEDYARMWLKVTWVLDGFPMRLLKWTPNFHPMRETPIVPVWITMPFLPVHLFYKNILYSIANLVGKPLKVDEPTANVTRPSLARVCVELDLTKPLVESVWVSETLDEAPDDIRSEGFHQNIEYEYVPPYCKHCYHVGHDEASCYSGKTSNAPQKLKTCDRPENQTNKGKEIMEEGKGQQKKQTVESGFMKDARKGDNHQWLVKKRNKVNPTNEVPTTSAKQDLITLDEDPLEDQLVNKRPAMENKTIEAMMAELLPMAQLQAVCGLKKDSVVVAEPSFVLEEPSEQVLEIATFDDHDSTMQFENTTCIDDLERQESDVEEEPEAPDRHGEYSRDDLLLLETKTTDRDDMSVHPHTHSRRKSVGDEVRGVEALRGNDDTQRDDNLRKSTRIRKQTFKVRKSPIADREFICFL